MSLPSYLAKIKSSGIYRYVFDKSEVPSQTAETLRLVVGYSEKGPFNTPVYVDNKQDFITLYGNINKRLEKKGYLNGYWNDSQGTSGGRRRYYSITEDGKAYFDNAIDSWKALKKTLDYFMRRG